MRTLTLRSTFSAAALALALTACPGDSDDDGSTSDPTNSTPAQTDPSAGSTGSTGPDTPTTSNDTPPGTDTTDDTTNTTPPSTETTNTTPPDETTTSDDTTTAADDTTTAADDTTTSDDTTGGGGLSFAVDIHAPIIANRCGCHTGGMSGGLGMGGTADSAYAAIVDVPSSAGIPYVSPGDSQNSYLWHKVNGTQADVGGGGGKMPQGGSLDPADVALIAEWIDMGALP